MKAEFCWIPKSKLFIRQENEISVNGCVGVVKLSTKDPSKLNYCSSTKSQNVPISHDDKNSWSEILRKIVGPLHLRLLLEGPEIVSATIFFDAEKCEYWLHFAVASPGFYGINFKFVHDDFWGVNEVSHNTKHNLNAYAFPRSMPLLKCEFQQEVEQESEEGTSSKSKSNQFVLKNNDNERWVQRPIGVDRFAGKFLIGNTLQRISFSERGVIGVDPRAVPPYGVAKLETKENAKHSLQLPQIMKDARLKQSLIFDFPLERWMNAEELIRIASDKKKNKKNQSSPMWIFIMGDSQSRSITWSLKNYLQTAEINKNSSEKIVGAEDESYQLRDKEGKKISRSSDFFLNGRWKISYMWDSYLDLLSEMTENDDEEEQKPFSKTRKVNRPLRHLNASEQEREDTKNDSLENADIFVAGLGHHPASWGQWTFQEYFEKSKKIASRLCWFVKNKRKKVFWYGAPAWPKAKLVNNFRGTNQRLALFNGLMLNHLKTECEEKRNVNLVLTSSGSGKSQKEEKIQQKRSENDVLYLVDFFGITSPVMKHSKDGSHFDGTVVSSTCAHQVFRNLL
jgi:hypothetical protein